MYKDIIIGDIMNLSEFIGHLGDKIAPNAADKPNEIYPVFWDPQSYITGASERGQSRGGGGGGLRVIYYLIRFYADFICTYPGTHLGTHLIKPDKKRVEWYTFTECDDKMYFKYQYIDPSPVL